MTYQTVNLRCEYLESPLAIDAPVPRLSWEGLCPRQGAAQSAYRILANDRLDALRRNEGNLWDSGRVESSCSFQIPYGGVPLNSHQQVFWKVMAWDENGKPGPWSAPTHWTMGILGTSEWKAGWIGNRLSNHQACPLVRREFKLAAKPRRVLLYTSALGLCHVTINGKPVGDDVFSPGWTDYKKRRLYRCHEVTRLVKGGTVNCIGAEIAEGWYKGNIGFSGHSQHYGGHTAVLVQMRIEYSNGKTETLVSDASWKSAFGPTLQASLYHGETVDAQLMPKGWDRPGFDDKAWSAAVVLAPASGVAPAEAGIPLQSYPAEPVRRTEELRAIRHWSVSPGKVVFDFGQNFAGRVRLSCKGRAGAVVRIRFGEMVNPDNTLYVENLRSALATDTYIMKGTTRETWEPKFTFHGFRYAEISGCPDTPGTDTLTGIVIGSDTTRAGRFECSSPMINQVYSNAVWTQRANVLEVPTDCPQRDERLGWTGDAQVFIRTAICNMDMAAFFTKWMNDLMDAQDPGGAFPNVAPNILDTTGIRLGDAAWGDAGVVCPWTLYQCYEDRQLLETMYPHMQSWVAYLKSTSKDLLRGPTLTHCFGDWLSIDADTPKEVVQTAHFAYAANITRQAAEALGRTEDAASYATLFNDIRTAFNNAFVQGDGTITGNTQTAYLMALKFGLLDTGKAAQAADRLVANIRAKKNHLSTGFIGTALIMSVLRDTGHLDLAYRLLENTTFPSWGYSVVNGATSIWERWNGWIKETGPGDVNMNSYSHYAYGAVVEWLFDTVAGIDHGVHGFRHFILRPQPGGHLDHAAAEFHSPYGRIRSAWRRQGKGFAWETTIPANTCATVYIPARKQGSVTLNGKKLEDQEHAELDGNGGILLKAGEYAFTW